MQPPSLTARAISPTGPSSASSVLLPYITRPAIDWARRHRADHDAPFWREVEGTMVFGDVSGFTKLSERLVRHGKVGAEEVADAINTCFERCSTVAYRCGGSLLKFGGDALLLLFTGEGHATRAAHAAVGMRASLRDRRAAGHHRRPGRPAHLHRRPPGTFHLFMVGRSHRELIVAGPAATATVAAEGTATAGEIVMSPSTAAALTERSRGPARGAALPAARPPGPAPDLPIVPAELDGVDLARHVPIAIRKPPARGRQRTRAPHRHRGLPPLRRDRRHRA